MQTEMSNIVQNPEKVKFLYTKKACPKNRPCVGSKLLSPPIDYKVFHLWWQISYRFRI